MVFPVGMYGCESWTIKTAEYQRIDAFKLYVGDNSWEYLGLQGDPTSPSWRRSVLGVHWKDWCWSWSSNTLATWCKELTHWKRLWCWERLKAGGEGGDRGWDGWMVSPTRWTWVWVNSGSWWWTGRPGVLQSMGLQRVGHDWATELNWTEHCLLELAQTHVHWAHHAIQPAHPLSSPSPPALNLPWHQGLFQWVGSSTRFTSFSLSDVLFFPMESEGKPYMILSMVSSYARGVWAVRFPMGMCSVWSLHTLLHGQCECGLEVWTMVLGHTGLALGPALWEFGVASPNLNFFICKREVSHNYPIGM